MEQNLSEKQRYTYGTHEGRQKKNNQQNEQYISLQTSAVHKGKDRKKRMAHGQSKTPFLGPDLAHKHSLYTDIYSILTFKDGLKREHITYIIYR